MTEKTAQPSQSWEFDPAGDDFYRIRSKAAGKAGCLGLDSRLVAVEVRSCTDSPSQLWRVGQVRAWARLFNKMTGDSLCLNAPASLAMDMRSCALFSNQAWEIDPVN